MRRTPGIGVAGDVCFPVPDGVEGDVPQRGGVPGDSALRLVQMGGVVDRKDGEAPVLIAQMGDAGVGEQRHGLGVGERDAEHRREHAAYCDAVRGDRHRAAGIGPYDIMQRLDGALLHVAEGLGPLQIKALGVVQEGVKEGRGLPDRVGKGHALPGADVDLPQAAVGIERHIAPARKGQRREAGPAQVAGVDRVDRHVPEARRETLHLLDAAGRDVAVPVALHVAVEIALRLHVPNYINFCHKTAS